MTFICFNGRRRKNLHHTCHSGGAEHIVRVLDAESEDQKQHKLGAGSDIHTADHGTGASHGRSFHLLNHMGTDLEACENGLGIWEP